MMNFLSWRYWLLTPGSAFEFYLPTLIGLSVLFFIATALYFFVRRSHVGPLIKKYLRGLPKHLYIVSLSGGFWVLCRNENVVYFSSRIVFLAILVYLLWSLIYYLNRFRNYQTDLSVHQERIERRKHLAAKKKNKKK